MADVFHRDDARRLLEGKYILFFGDSNMRALYKDCVTLFNKNRLITISELRKKLARSFEGDILTDNIGLTRGRDFKEHRIFDHRSDQTLIEFVFITRCLAPDVTKILDEIASGRRRIPDVIIMNSTLWDVTRWGCKSVTKFKNDLQDLVRIFKETLPEQTLVVWPTSPPVSKGGFLIPEIKFMIHTIRFETMEANMFVHDLFASTGFDVCDFNFHLNLHVTRRDADGVHWMPKPVRYMTNLLLTHISIAWGKALPGRLPSTLLTKLTEKLEEEPVKSEQPPVRVKAFHRLGKPVSTTASRAIPSVFGCVPPAVPPAVPPPKEDLRTLLRVSKQPHNNEHYQQHNNNNNNNNYKPRRKKWQPKWDNGYQRYNPSHNRNPNDRYFPYKQSRCPR